MRAKYYQSNKFKIALTATIFFLAGTASLLYFTVTNCLQECSQNDIFPKPCLHEGKAYCCPSGDLPASCYRCE